MDTEAAGIADRAVAMRYGIAALAVVGAVAVRFALDPILGNNTSFVLFELAVMVASRFGGRGPGLAATASGVLAAWYLFLAPRYSFFVNSRADVLNLVLFVVVGAGISLLSGQLREAVFSRARQERAARKTELEYRALFEHMSEGLAYCRMHFENGEPEDFSYLAVNRAFEDLTGLKNVVGKRVTEVIPGIRESDPGLFEIYGRVARTGKPEKFETFVEALGMWFSISAYGPEEGYFVAVFDVITARKRVEEEIRQLNADLERRVRERTAELEASNGELEAFAYSVSHDLRAPLRGIDGWSLALLEDYGGSFDERAKEYLERVRAETQRMGVLIDDLLQLSRVTRVEMRRDTVDLTSAAREIAVRLAEAHAGRQIAFSVQAGLAAPGDGRLLGIALTNLLDNAVKFTAARAQARIEVGRNESGGEPAFYVRDNGAGFDMAYAGTLFGAFQRLHKSSEFPGTGVGLATVQRIVRRHGGRVWAEAQPGRGATFYFTLGAAK